MAFAAAAEVGAKDKAAAFLADYEAAPGPVSRYLRTLSEMAVVYGKARLRQPPGCDAGTAGASRPTATERPRALSSMRSLSAWPSATGTLRPGCLSWSPSWRAAGRRRSATMPARSALTSPADHLEAAKSCEDAELWAFAALAYDAAANAYRAAGDTLRERMATSQRKRCLDRADSSPGKDTEAEADAGPPDPP